MGAQRDGMPTRSESNFFDPVLMGDAYTFTLLEKGRISPLLQSSMFVYCLEMRWTLLCHGPGPSMEKKEIGRVSDKFPWQVFSVLLFSISPPPKKHACLVCSLGGHIKHDLIQKES